MAKIGVLPQFENMDNKKQYTFKIVLTGPESSGKTQLARHLAQTLNTIWAPEFARFYLAHLGKAYRREDLAVIGRGQKAWEDWYSAQASGPVICDTDWTVLQIWEHFRFGPAENTTWIWQRGYGNPQLADLYFLCSPDFPWEPDPLRENPDERGELFQWYEQLLLDRAANFRVLSGAHSVRLETALAEIRKLFGHL